MDLVICILFIVFILSWLSLIVGLLIVIDSPGPVFFVQKRVGKTGKTFNCFKFRTMIINREADEKQAVLNDERITKVGEILRRFNVDEFPQFINVLLGQMSIIGPRPHMHSDSFLFSQVIPGYKFRSFVKPGITGLAQVKGFHGPATENSLIEARFYWDAFYIRHASLELDLKIVHTSLLHCKKWIEETSKVFSSANSLH